MEIQQITFIFTECLTDVLIPLFTQHGSSMFISITHKYIFL